MRRLTLLLPALPTAALAEEVPVPLTAPAAISYALAAVGLIVALGVVQWLVTRR
jgi:hypothetical protein